MLLFRSQRGADLYAIRDAALASGHRAVQEALYARIAPLRYDNFENETTFDQADEAFREVFWAASGLAAFESDDAWYLVSQAVIEEESSLNRY